MKTSSNPAPYDPNVELDMTPMPKRDQCFQYYLKLRGSAWDAQQKALYQWNAENTDANWERFLHASREFIKARDDARQDNRTSHLPRHQLED